MPDRSDNGAGSPRPVVFLDKDGTLVENVPFSVDPALLRFTPRAGEGLRQLIAAGFRLVLVTNQPGVARGLFTREAFARLTLAMQAKLRADEQVDLRAIYACPHAPDAAGRPLCACRKPMPGLLLQAARELGIDLPRSWLIGHLLDDIEAGHAAGCRTVLLNRGGETEWRRSAARTPDHVCADLGEAAHAIAGADAARAA